MPAFSLARNCVCAVRFLAHLVCLPTSHTRVPVLATGHVTRAEWFTYIEQHYTSSAERDALFSIVEAQIQMAFLFVRRALAL